MDRIAFELVKDSGDMTHMDTVHEIDTCVYAMETYPKGYAKVSQVAAMPDGGEWNADWHPQGANRHGNLRDDTVPSQASKAADEV